MNKRKKKKQKWVRWIGGDYRSNKILWRHRHEEVVVLKQKGRVEHLTDEDVKNCWLTTDMSLEEVKKYAKWRRPLRGSKTALKKIEKALAQGV